MYYHKLFESWGRGVRLIIDGCVEAGHPSPVYSINSGGLLLTMPYQSATMKRQKLAQKEKLTDQQKEVVTMLQKTPLSSSELQELLSFSPSERWVRNTLNKLREWGYVDAVGQTTARKWFVIKK